MAPGGGVPPCDRVWSRPLESNTLCDNALILAPFKNCRVKSITYLLLGSLCRTRTLNAIATLDNICLQAYRPRSTVELQEETTSIAENGANLISSPEWSSRGRAVLAGWLCCFAIVSSHRSHDCGIGGLRCYRGL